MESGLFWRHAAPLDPSNAAETEELEGSSHPLPVLEFFMSGDCFGDQETWFHSWFPGIEWQNLTRASDDHKGSLLSFAFSVGREMARREALPCGLLRSHSKQI